VCISKLSDEERGELLRIIDKLSQQLEEQELASVLNQKFAAFYQALAGVL
jgi:hypothetical protein